MGQNKTLLLFYLFLFVTILWSEYPFVTFKRWYKELGGIFVILIILTEQDPLEAIKAVFARCAYVLFPLSVVFIKYFPGIGRTYTQSGGAMYTGVTQQKNSLGEIVLVFGLVLLSELFQANRPKEAKAFKEHHFTILFVLVTGLWLLVTSNSKTSLICFIAGAVIIVGHKLAFFKNQPRRILIVICTVIPLFLFAESQFNISEYLLELVGRNSTLTGRTDIWQAVKENPVDPLIGSGYMMYWDLHKSIQIGRFVLTGWKSAHNGYLETYLDGGILGVVCLAVMLIGVGVRVIREFLRDTEYGRLAFAFYVAMLLYNIAESMYARRSPLWFAFLLFGLEFRGCLPSAMSREANVVADVWIDEREAVDAGRA